jgi:Domain of unknown function (DUF1905)
MSSSTHYTVQFEAEVWLWQSKGAWHFLTLPLDKAQELQAVDGTYLHIVHHKKRRGWGSIPVTVRIGSSTWDTSIFPDTRSDSYILPLKSDIRKREKIAVGHLVSVEIQIAMP